MVRSRVSAHQIMTHWQLLQPRWMSTALLDLGHISTAPSMDGSRFQARRIPCVQNTLTSNTGQQCVREPSPAWTWTKDQKLGPIPSIKVVLALLWMKYSLPTEVKIHGDGPPSRSPNHGSAKSQFFLTVMTVATVWNSTLLPQLTPRSCKRHVKKLLNG